jgi:hypothetical protein
VHRPLFFTARVSSRAHCWLDRASESNPLCQLQHCFDCIRSTPNWQAPSRGGTNSSPILQSLCDNALVHAACYDPPDRAARLVKKSAVGSLAVVINDENWEIRFRLVARAGKQAQDQRLRSLPDRGRRVNLEVTPKLSCPPSSPPPLHLPEASLFCQSTALPTCAAQKRLTITP